MDGIDGSVLKFFESTPFSIATVLLNLALAAGLAFLISWHFRRYGSTFSNRSKFARVLPVLTLTTMLIITVIKSSLALSLGLVGALSIIRFRTPVKEPEELAYIFLSIASGLALGADQQVLALCMVPAILVVMSIQAAFRKTSQQSNVYLNVEIPQDNSKVAADEGTPELDALVDSISTHTSRLNLRRYDVNDGALQASFHMDCDDVESLVKLEQGVRKLHPSASLSFVERSSIQGV
ncbi:MAG: DUF4956 domain-containing protein [Planctomycetota bacterium]